MSLFVGQNNLKRNQVRDFKGLGSWSKNDEDEASGRRWFQHFFDSNLKGHHTDKKLFLFNLHLKF